MCLSNVKFNLANYDEFPNKSRLVGTGYKVICVNESPDLSNQYDWIYARYTQTLRCIPKRIMTENGRDNYWPGFHILQSYEDAVKYYKYNWYTTSRLNLIFNFVQVSYSDIVCIGEQRVAEDLCWDNNRVAKTLCVVADKMKINEVISTLKFNKESEYSPRYKAEAEIMNLNYKLPSEFYWR